MNVTIVVEVLLNNNSDLELKKCVRSMSEPKSDESLYRTEMSSQESSNTLKSEIRVEKSES